MNLLESAGFSRSNPYYIVIQGQVQALTKMTPGERLELLKEVAGTRVYDERRAESLKIMKESGMCPAATIAIYGQFLFLVADFPFRLPTEGKKEKIEEVLGMLDSRLAELEEEKDELTAYRDLDRDRRALEFLIFERELDDAKTEIRKIEDSRSGDSDRVNEVHQQSIEAHETYVQRLNYTCHWVDPITYCVRFWFVLQFEGKGKGAEASEQ
jgi:structural maintenance of chromosome 3 (chondroitin sulfate proteoglycan 6)